MTSSKKATGFLCIKKEVSQPITNAQQPISLQQEIWVFLFNKDVTSEMAVLYPSPTITRLEKNNEK